MTETTEAQTSQEPEPVRGIVALFDALGFRQVAANYEPREVVHSLAKLRHQLEMEAALRSLMVRGNRLQAGCFSDTLILVMTVKHGSLADALVTVAEHIADALHSAATGVCGVPLLFRGCITIGEVFGESGLFVGPAVNEVADWYEQADAAVVWFSPRAAQELRAAPPNLHVFEWDVPLKKGNGPFRTFVVNPLAFQGPEYPQAIPELVEAYLRPFDALGGSTRVDVVVKRRLTEELMRLATEHTLLFGENGRSNG